MILITAHHLTACIVLVLCAIEVAEEVFNRCTFTNATKDGQIRPDSKDYRVIFNYEFLEDFQDRKSKIVRALTRRYINVGASWSHNQLVAQPAGHTTSWSHNQCFNHQRKGCMPLQYIHVSH